MGVATKTHNCCYLHLYLCVKTIFSSPKRQLIKNENGHMIQHNTLKTGAKSMEQFCRELCAQQSYLDEF